MNSTTPRKSPTDSVPEKLPERVGIIFSEVKREYFPTEEQYLTEKDAEKDAIEIAEFIEKLGIKTTLYPGDDDLACRLSHDKPEMVFNLVDSIRGKEYLAAAIPGTLELLGIPYTGAGMLGQALNSNKFLVKKLMQQVGVPVPHYQLFNTATDPINQELRFPLISKLNEIHGAVEITEDSVSENEKHLRNRLKYMISTYKQPVLVEEFIVGREITAMVVEGGNRKVYLAETIFKPTADQPQKKYDFKTFYASWVEHQYDSFHYEKYDDDRLKEILKTAFEVTKMEDYAKFDIRLDSSNRYYLIDANTNPAFGPKVTAIAVILNMYGIQFDDILKRMISNTLKPDVVPNGSNISVYGNDKSV